MAKERAQALDIDGTWSFADEGPLRAAKVTMDIWEGPEAERIRHEARCEWGRYIDPYAAKFQLGDISKFTGFTKDKDVPIGKHRVGSFIMRANVHRPLVGKDFQGFQ
ncbi:hypothetical protein EON65_38865 [archaeon]|nr:MAG: hypothetical protein EON65_38865 [archaeon]